MNMFKSKTRTALSAFILGAAVAAAAPEPGRSGEQASSAGQEQNAGTTAVFQEISETGLRDRIAAFWYGQLVGNFMGYPFESVYNDTPVPVLVDRYYDYRDAGEVNITTNDVRGVIRHVTGYYGGAVSDDDTDIELVTLHAVEKYGLDITYPEITDMWKLHINRNIWAANAEARRLMNEGFVPPATGAKENNRHWFKIDPQLVNEIWSVFYPGMTDKAVARAEWGARITCEDWGTHPTRFYAYICSRAFFETDTRLLVEAALDVIPEGSPFREGLVDVLKWHREHKDWRETRKLIHENYYRYQKGDYKAPVSGISSLCNGLCGALALLYGEGDFMKTVGIAISAGYDCDNQAATCAGIIGLMKGPSVIPDRLTKEMPNGKPWDTPFNNRYLNITRDGLPNVFTLDDLIDRTLRITEQAILEEGGRKEEKNGRTVLIVPCSFGGGK